LRATLREQAAEIAAELQGKRLAAKTVESASAIRDFTTLNRQITFQDPTSDARAITGLGAICWPGTVGPSPVAAAGLGVSNLVPPGQHYCCPLDKTNSV